jgi:hypothetical protein
MEPTVERRRGAVLRLVGLFALMAALVALVLGLRMAGSSGAALNTNDPMSMWSEASLESKQASAKALVEQFEREGKFGPITKQRYRGFDGRRRLVEDMVLGLDTSADRMQKEYVSPGEPIRRTAEAIVVRQGWDK